MYLFKFRCSFEVKLQHMKNYIVLFREPDGRKLLHSEEEITRHRQNWQTWMEKWGTTGHLTGGNSLTLDGRIIRGIDTPASKEGQTATTDTTISKEAQTTTIGKESQSATTITKTTHTVGTEIVGGFLLLKADSLDAATDIARTCPIYEFDGYAEVREMQ